MIKSMIKSVMTSRGTSVINITAGCGAKIEMGTVLGINKGA